MNILSTTVTRLSMQRRAWLGALLAVPLAFGLISCGGGDDAPTKWVASWYGAPQVYDEPPLNGKPAKSFANQTYRQIMTVSTGGTSLRVRVSNLYGAAALNITSVRVAKSTTGSSIDAATDKAVTFNGQASVVVPAGQELNSDPVDFQVAANGTVAVSTFVASAANVDTIHLLGLQSNYVAAGNVASSATITPTETNTFYAWVTGIDVVNAAASKVVVAFGDSITDGYASTANQNRRYPDVLSRTLQSGANGSTFSVVNAGISGNRWSFNGVGPNGNARFAGDVLGRAGVTHAVLLLGINDIGIPSLLGNAAEQVTSDAIVQAISNAAAAARTRGVKVYVGTLGPFAGTLFPNYYTPAGEVKRQAVNAFVRSTKLIDGVIDFDAAIRDPANPAAILAAYDSGDHLHPNDAGYALMAATAAAVLNP